MIGIFDSGYGGLTVMKEYLKRYPEFDYMYLGDQANVPYGNRSKERINYLVEKNIKYLVDQGCELIIVACNTASADALRHVQNIYQGKPVILGVIIPAVEEALKKSRFGNIGLIATRGTVESKAYEREIKKYQSTHYKPKDKKALKEVKISSKKCPLLVPLIEEGADQKVVNNKVLKKYLRPLKESSIDTLILGCTHYPLLQKEIQRLIGKKTKIISSAEAAVMAISDYFKRHPNLFKKLSKKATRTFLTTDCPNRFEELGSRFLKEKFKAKKIEIR